MKQKLPNPFADVQAFIEKYELPCAVTPDIEYENALMRGIKHLQEELDELQDALNMEDYIQTCDALVDLVWVAIRIGFNCGLPMPEIWKAVYDSNMNGKRKVFSADESKRGDPHDIIKMPDWVSPDDAISDALRTKFEEGNAL